MKTSLPSLLVLLAVFAAGPTLAQEATLREVSEPQIKRTVIEDDQVRIEELKVRGQTQRIVVRPKSGAPAYEIVPADSGREIATGRPGSRGNVGQRQWHVLSF